MMGTKSSISLGDIVREPSLVEDDPYIYVAPSRMGAFGKYVVNVPYYRNWLNNTVSWKVQKSTDGLKWVDYQKFTVKKDWNRVNLSEKHTVIVDADEDAFYRILTNTNADKQLVSFEDKSSVTLYELNFKVSEDKSYTLLYNWSDYSKSTEASKTVLSKSVKTDVLSSKQYFEWAVTSSVKLKAGEQFVLDPVYGTVGDAVTDSWEYDAQEALIHTPFSVIKLGDSEYYASVANGDTGTDYDGFIRTFKVFDSNGTIKENIISSWEYDVGSGWYAGISNIYSDIYAIIYANASIGRVITTTIWSSNGTCKQNIIDSFNLSYQVARYPRLVKITSNVYAAVYQDEASGYDHQIETIWINNSGTINNTKLDLVEFDATSTVASYSLDAVMVDSDTIAIVWAETVGKDTWLCTINITSTGDVSASKADSWEFYIGGTTISDYSWCVIKDISGDTFLIGYIDTIQDGWAGTINITSGGNIVGTSFIDTLEWKDAETIVFLSTIFTVADASVVPGGVGVYGFTFKDATGDGWVYTINVSNTGVMPATINDALQFTTFLNAFSSTVHMSGNYYLSLLHDSNYDGYVYTYTIETYEAPTAWSNVCPVASGEHPTNSTTGINLQPAVGATITDGNSNHTMNVTFATNSSGSWHNFQTNTSVANNSAVNWTMSMAGTGNAGYSWRVYVHDGFCNQSFTFSFTTAANATPPVNHDPSVTAAFPTDDATGISVNVNRHNITVSDPDGNLMNYSYRYFIEGCNLAGDNAGAVSNGTYSLILNDDACCPLEYDTVYTWWVNVSDGNGGYDNETFSFTTESPEQRTPTNIFDYYFVCGNETSRTPTNIFDSWFLCGNDTTRSSTNVFDYWFQCSNTTSRISTNVYDYYFLCGNTSSRQPTEIFDYWFLCGNETSRTSTESFDYYFVCGNGTTRVATEVFDYWFLCGNETSRNPLQIFDYYFQCGNTTSRIQTDIFDYYFECGNMTSRNPAQVFDYYFICGNTSSRSPTEIFDNWFLCGNETTRTPTSIFDSWFLCGNISGRTPINVLDHWFLCGNGSGRSETQIFDYYFICGNNTQRNPTEIFDNWFLCGNGTGRNPTEIFDYYFLCGNSSLNIHILLSNPVPTITTTLSINKNNITNHTGDLQISITRNHTHGWNMSTSIWFNNTFLFTNTSLGNGTITFWLFDYYNNPIISGVDYNWTVNCTNGTTYTNQTYTFRIRVQKGTTSILPIKERDLPLSLVIGAILSLLMSLIWKRKKRKRRRPVIIGQPIQQQYSRGTPRR